MNEPFEHAMLRILLRSAEALIYELELHYGVEDTTFKTLDALIDVVIDVNRELGKEFDLCETCFRARHLVDGKCEWCRTRG